MDHPIPIRTSYPVLINKEKRTSNLVKLVVPLDDRVKMKENEKADEYLTLSKDLLLCNIFCGRLLVP